MTQNAPPPREGGGAKCDSQNDSAKMAVGRGVKMAAAKMTGAKMAGAKMAGGCPTPSRGVTTM